MLGLTLPTKNLIFIRSDAPMDHAEEIVSHNEPRLQRPESKFSVLK